MRIGVGFRWIILYLIGVHFYCLPLPFAVDGDDSRVQGAFSLIKGENESCFWFVNKGNLGRKLCVWLMLIEKNLKG